MTAAPLQHLPVFGGVAAWYLPLMTTALVLGAVGIGVLELTVALGALGLVANMILRGMVLELSPVGLTRGLLLNGSFVGRTTVIAWDAVASMHSEWRRPGDDTALVTTVRDRQGRAIHFTTAMGLGAYWACLAAIAARAPAADCSGLTPAILSSDAPGRRSVASAAVTAAALALVIVAFAGIQYIWAQGRGGASRPGDRPFSAAR
jgi:hypothetical protein